MTVDGKGSITCPKCGQKIIAEIHKDVSTFHLICPNCNHHFKVVTSQINLSDTSSDASVNVETDCKWEEHGEPRKTILSSIKPRTDKPMIASVLLIIVILITLISALFPTLFLQAPLQAASFAGVKGDVTVFLDNNSAIAPVNITLYIDHHQNEFIQINNAFTASTIPLGKHQLNIESSGGNRSHQLITEPVYVLPFDASTFTIKITDTHPLTLDESLIQFIVNNQSIRTYEHKRHHTKLPNDKS